MQANKEVKEIKTHMQNLQISAAQVAPSIELRYQAAGMCKQLEPPMGGRSNTYASTVRQNLQSRQHNPTRAPTNRQVNKKCNVRRDKD